MLKKYVFNNNLRKERENKNITQTEMANLINVPVSTYRNYENTTRQPDFETLINISKALNVSIDKLLGNSSKEGIMSEITTKLSSLDKESLKKLDLFIDFLNYKYSQYKGTQNEK